MNDIIRYAGLATPGPVSGPRLGQKDVRVNQGLVLPLAHGQVNGDDAILDLAQAATPLPLHARGVSPFLDVAGLVDDADAAQASAIGQHGQQASDVALEFVTGRRLVPDVGLEELLQVAFRDARGQGHDLGVLAPQVGQQAADVSAEQGMVPGKHAGPLVGPQEGHQGRLQGANLVGSHGSPRLSGLPKS